MQYNIGFIGLGNMGGAIAERLARVGHRVVGFDLSEAARERASTAGVISVDTPEAAFEGASVIFSSLPNPAIVTDFWLGVDERSASLAQGVTLVELSTIDPETMRQVAAAVPEHSAVVDCPVSGGPGEARSGRLNLLVGAEPAVFDRMHDLLAQFGGTVHHAGGVGAGKAVKLVNNIMSMTNVLVASEAFALGLAYGLDPQRLYDILSVSGGTSGQFVKRFPRAIAGDYDPRFALSLGTKDLALALDFARQLGVPTPTTATARQMYAVAEAEGLGGLDHVALLKLYQQWTPEPSH